MTPKQLFQAGQLNDAITALSAEMRDNPMDAQRRTFLFELLCFSGDYDRARKHLELLAKANQQAGMGALLYEACMNSERTRAETFEKKDFPTGTPKPSRRGKLNGQDFESIEDADPRIGPRLELYTAGSYMWLPLEHVDRIEMQAPKRLRDLLWAPIVIQTSATFRQAELGESLTPVLCPASSKHADDAVKLGRSTVWEEADGEVVPFGQKIFLVDGEEVPILEIRTIEFEPAPETAESESE